MGNVNNLGPSIDPNQIYQNDLNIDNDLQTTKTTVNNNSAAINAQQAQLNTTQATANSASTAITTHIAQTTGAHAASAISETRLGDAQSALNDVNTRVTNIVGQTGSSNTEIVDARQSTPENNVFTVLKDRLDTSDNIQAIIDQARADITREAINSGVYRFSAITAGNTATPNAFAIAQEEANVNGQRLNLGTPTIQLSAPPAANVTPALPGSARDDLIFIEMWKQWVAPGGTLYANGNVNGTTSVATYGQYQWQWREREVDGVDFATYPEGLSASNVFAQGARGTVGTVVFAKSTTDTGLYTASDATGAPIDGLVYAIPLFRVRRRNTTAYDPDTNPLGGRLFDNTYTLSYGPINTGYSETITVTGGSGLNVGDTLIYSGGYQLYIAANLGSNQYTALNVGGNLVNSITNQTGWYHRSDRPDGLYSNIIDASDLHGGDLRHQVSPTGYNMQALLEKNLDLTLRAQLFTSKAEMYINDHIGVNLSGYTDDVNSLLFCNFDGSINGTANGVAVNGTTSGTATYVNGVQGTGITGLSGTESVSYAVASPAQGTIEALYKLAFTPGDGNFHTIVSATLAGTQTFQLAYDNNGNLYVHYNTSTGSVVGVISKGATFQRKGDWIYVQTSWSGTASGSTINLQYNELTATTQLTGTFGGFDTLDVLEGRVSSMDSVRISNIVRTGTPLPTGFSYAEGDRILDGAMADFNTWSDDVGGITGVNGRTNPYGLTHVPNQVHAKVAYNGAEVRQYFGTGITPGWVPSNNGLFVVTGAFDSSSEYANVTANEVADGTRTTFTFTKPLNTLGQWIVSPNSFIVNNTPATISSKTIDSATGTLTVVAAVAPTAGQSVFSVYTTASRHAHLIPSTKGFVLHDWTDDTYSSVNGTQTAFQTTKYNVTSLNHVRVTLSASTVATIQNGGYTTQGLNCATTLTASAASTATSLTVGSSANMFAGQNIRISKGDGTWYTTTVTSITNATTIVVPALTVGLTSGATIQGTAQTTFTTAPAAASTVDIVYESVITPSEGDYLRIAYQHTPYQGTGITDSCLLLHRGRDLKVVTYGTGKVQTNGGIYAQPITPNIPLGSSFADASFKSDAITTVSLSSGQYAEGITLNSSQGTTNLYSGIHEGSAIHIQNSGSPIRGKGAVSPTFDQWGATQQLSVGIPHVNVHGSLLLDTVTGEMYLLVESFANSTTYLGVYVDNGQNCSADLFKLQGRQLIKGYAGVTN